MAQVIFKRKTTAEIKELPIVDGQLIWNIETGETYIDIGKERIATGGSGVDGKSAYQYAQESGYTGTEEEFSEKLAQENPTKEEFDNLSEKVVNLPSSGEMSANTINLLITVLRAGLFSEDQSENITLLEQSLKNVSIQESDVTQSGTILKIISGVTATQNNSVLAII